MLAIALLTVVCVITYSFEIVFGLAGTIVMVMIMAHFFDTKTLVVYSALPQLLVAVIGLARSPKTVDIRYLSTMVGFAAAGALLGLYLFYIIPPHLFHVILATAVTLSGVYLVAWPGRLHLSTLGVRALDTIAGMSQALFGISGPIAMTRLLGSFDDKLVIRNYALAFFLSMNLFRVGAYLLRGTFTHEILFMMGVTGPFLIAALWFANHLHLKVNQRLFRTIVAWIILLGGVSMLLNPPNH